MRVLGYRSISIHPPPPNENYAHLFANLFKSAKAVPVFLLKTRVIYITMSEKKF